MSLQKHSPIAGRFPIITPQFGRRVVIPAFAKDRSDQESRVRSPGYVREITRQRFQTQSEILTNVAWIKKMSLADAETTARMFPAVAIPQHGSPELHEAHLAFGHLTLDCWSLANVVALFLPGNAAGAAVAAVIIMEADAKTVLKPAKANLGADKIIEVAGTQNYVKAAQRLLRYQAEDKEIDASLIMTEAMSVARIMAVTAEETLVKRRTSGSALDSDSKAALEAVAEAGYAYAPTLHSIKRQELLLDRCANVGTSSSGSYQENAGNAVEDVAKDGQQGTASVDGLRKRQPSKSATA